MKNLEELVEKMVYILKKILQYPLQEMLVEKLKAHSKMDYLKENGWNILSKEKYYRKVII